MSGTPTPRPTPRPTPEIIMVGGEAAAAGAVDSTATEVVGYRAVTAEEMAAVKVGEGAEEVTAATAAALDPFTW
jgi:hypothetical protein